MPSQQSKIFSRSSLMLFVLVIADMTFFTGYFFQKSFYVGLLLLYVMLDVLGNTLSRKKLLFGIPLAEFCRRQKHVLMLAFIFFLVIWPTISQMSARLQYGSGYFVHDSVIQTEEAVKFLLDAKNPYTENYTNTSLAGWKYWNPGFGENPAFYHFTYLPFLPLTILPFQAVSTAFLGWFDARLVLILLFAVAVAAIEISVRNEENKLELLALFSLNPWFTDFFYQGRNDIVPLAWIVLCIAALRSKHISLSSLFLAFACASKQTAWPLVPFYLAYLMKGSFSLASLRKALSQSWVLFLATFLLIMPFLLWDYGSFIDDVFSYQSGTATASYPAGGYGFATFLVELGFIGQNGYFPFWTLQLLFGIPLMFYLMKKQKAHNTLGNMVASYSLLTFLILFFSRSLRDNYLGYLVSLMALGYYLDDER
jgi:hypothetical protein